MRELAGDVDVVLVIGAHNSSNSNRLRERAAEINGVSSYLIEDASHLNEEWVRGKKARRHYGGRFGSRRFGAGTDRTLRELEPVEVSVMPGVQENVHFHLPLSLTKAEPRKKTSAA